MQEKFGEAPSLLPAPHEGFCRKFLPASTAISSAEAESSRERLSPLLPIRPMTGRLVRKCWMAKAHRPFKLIINNRSPSTESSIISSSSHTSNIMILFFFTGLAVLVYYIRCPISQIVTFMWDHIELDSQPGALPRPIQVVPRNLHSPQFDLRACGEPQYRAGKRIPDSLTPSLYCKVRHMVCYLFPTLLFLHAPPSATRNCYPVYSVVTICCVWDEQRRVQTTASACTCVL